MQARRARLNRVTCFYAVKNAEKDHQGSHHLFRLNSCLLACRFPLERWLLLVGPPNRD